jgi:hypothetical protein
MGASRKTKEKIINDWGEYRRCIISKWNRPILKPKYACRECVRKYGYDEIRFKIDEKILLEI